MPSLGLAMIVKDGVATLARCMGSVQGAVNQIVVVDTGSSDGSVELARGLGAEVFEIPWPDSFAEARNVAVRKLSTDWVLVLDDDEALDNAGRERLPAVLEAAESGAGKVGGYLVTVRNHLPVKFVGGGRAAAIKAAETEVPGAEQAQACAEFEICRLFRRQAGISYEGRVHEHVEPSIRRLGLKIAPANFLIHHFGHLATAEELRAKDEFYRRLGRLKVQDNPRDAEAWVELGLQEYEQFGNYSEGMECLKRALALRPSAPAVAALALARLYVDIQAEERALALLAGMALRGGDAGQKEHICGDALYNLGRLKEARAAYLRALSILREDARVLSKLGLTEVRLQMKKSGISRLLKAVRENPGDFEIHDRLVKAYLAMNQVKDAAEAAEEMAAAIPLPVAFLRAASIHGHLRQWSAAEEIIRRGLELFPQHGELLQMKGELERELFSVAAV
jgi:tetratricopeptide (TPR) repeat protein